MRNRAYYTRIKKILTVFFVVGIFTQCDENQSVVPDVFVDFTIMLNDPEFSSLHVPGNSITVTGGVNGIIIYRISSEEFAAYDRTCTHNVDENCRVIADQSSLFAIDTLCCGSKFLLLDGSVHEGEATYPLKRYRSFFDGNYLRVYN